MGAVDLAWEDVPSWKIDGLEVAAEERWHELEQALGAWERNRLYFGAYCLIILEAY